MYQKSLVSNWSSWKQWLGIENWKDSFRAELKWKLLVKYWRVGCHPSAAWLIGGRYQCLYQVKAVLEQSTGTEDGVKWGGWGNPILSFLQTLFYTLMLHDIVVPGCLINQDTEAVWGGLDASLFSASSSPAARRDPATNWLLGLPSITRPALHYSACPPISGGDSSKEICSRQKLPDFYHSRGNLNLFIYQASLVSVGFLTAQFLQKA